MFKSVRVANHGNADVKVFAVFSDKKPVNGMDTIAKNLLQRPEFSGEQGSFVDDYSKTGRTFIVGLGKKQDVAPSTFRIAGAVVGRKLASLKCKHAQITSTISNLESAAAFSESIGLLAWNYTGLRGTATKQKTLLPLTISSSDSQFTKGLKKGLQIAESVNLSRTVSMTPPNIATPLWISKKATQIAKQTGMKCTIFQGRALQKEELTGLLQVGKASENPPCLIRIEYRPKGAKGKPVVLVGKTVTYDTGGLTLKVNNGMVGMKGDKDGGCAVLGAMHAIATVIKPNFPVIGLLSAAENSVSGNAYRPDDVIRFRNGVTVEVTNTDAEGRLVLADALCFACDCENPRCIVDLATLTGGVVTALGKFFAGYFCEDTKLRDKLEASANATGEKIWRLPVTQEYRDMLKSPIADIINSNPNRQAHPIQGAAFLSYFVDEEIPWAHIDIAGTHRSSSDKGAFIEGPNGFGVRLLAHFIENL